MYTSSIDSSADCLIAKKKYKKEYYISDERGATTINRGVFCYQ